MVQEPGLVPVIRQRGRDVVLRVWGVSERDREKAEIDARNYHGLYGYRIADVVHADVPAPAAGDRYAIASGADYDRTWAAYPAECPADEREAAA